MLFNCSKTKLNCAHPRFPAKNRGVPLYKCIVCTMYIVQCTCMYVLKNVFFSGLLPQDLQVSNETVAKAPRYTILYKMYIIQNILRLSNRRRLFVDVRSTLFIKYDLRQKQLEPWFNYVTLYCRINLWILHYLVDSNQEPSKMTFFSTKKSFKNFIVFVSEVAGNDFFININVYYQNNENINPRQLLCTFHLIGICSVIIALAFFVSITATVFFGFVAGWGPNKKK